MFKFLVDRIEIFIQFDHLDRFIIIPVFFEELAA